MNRTRSFLILFVLSLCFLPVFQCKVQTSDFKIVAEPYQWNEDMKRLKITTPERGLTFKITISNDGTQAIAINKIYINVRVEYGVSIGNWRLTTCICLQRKPAIVL